jgi:uncharacterized membrane protein
MAAATLPSAVRHERVDSVDLLRGIVMVLMALDHVRDFTSIAHFDPTEIDKTTVPLFVTRWVTHFCAPTFVFLAGTGAFLSMTRGKPKKELARFLFTRGLWLVLLELTAVHFGWTWTLAPLVGLQVIWALGWSMVAMAAIVFLPRPAIAAFGVGLIALHNLADPVRAESLGRAAPLWHFLHQFGFGRWGKLEVVLAYPLVPWVGVMAAGHSFGELLVVDAAKRRRRLALLGGALTLAFVILRFAAIYGDPHPWKVQATAAKTIMAFFACEKYPPSLLYLLMTLGPLILALAAFDRVAKSPRVEPLIVFGRVPLFYYLLHLQLIHVVSLVAAYVVYGHAVPFVFDGPFTSNPPDWYGYGLPSVYALWMLVVILLYPACRWFAGVKARRRDAWLSYL